MVHATAVVVGETGVLIRGPSGAGKSALALALIASAGPARFVRLVGDDRVELTARGGRLLARGHPGIAGLIERRGAGIVAAPFEPVATIGLVADLVAPAECARLPEPAGPRVEILGIALPGLALPQGRTDPGAILAALEQFRGSGDQANAPRPRGL